MFNIFSNKQRIALFAMLSLGAINVSMADDCCESSSRHYIGAFGGGIYSNSSKISQFGTAFFPEAVLGPLPIIGEGHLNKTSTGFGGVQIGCEWSKPSCSCWSFTTGAELEAFFFKTNKKGNLINQTVVGLPEHNFYDSFHMNSSVVLANATLSFNSDNLCLCGFTPYVGGGMGAARISIDNAYSLQVEPVEADVNHFNSRRDDSTWTFAAQAKAGLRYNFCDMFHVFAEYRYVYVDASHYVFGSTNYPTHVPTSPWNVRIKNANYNAFVLGLQFDL